MNYLWHFHYSHSVSSSCLTAVETWGRTDVLKISLWQQCVFKSQTQLLQDRPKQFFEKWEILYVALYSYKLSTKRGLEHINQTELIYRNGSFGALDFVITLHQKRGNGIVMANPLLMAYHSFPTALIAVFYWEAENREYEAEKWTKREKHYL